MTPDEVVVLARYVRALCPQQKFDEYTPDAWHDVLSDYRLADARAAAAAVAKRQPFVSPAEIITEIKQQRSDRATDFQGPGLSAEVPDADPDDVRAYLAALRGQRTRAADGLELKRRPVAELLAGVGRDIPPEVAEVRRPGPLGIECPKCQAPIGRPCRLSDGKERAPHGAREAAAKGEYRPEEDVAEAARRREASRRHLESLPDGAVVEPQDGFGAAS
ncbi:zinc finger domain-containing protein [Streptomyces sp. NPDC002519]